MVKLTLLGDVSSIKALFMANTSMGAPTCRSAKTLSILIIAAEVTQYGLIIPARTISEIHTVGGCFLVFLLRCGGATGIAVVLAFWLDLPRRRVEQNLWWFGLVGDLHRNFSARDKMRGEYKTDVKLNNAVLPYD